MTELQGLNPRATTLRVHCHPWQVPADVKLFAAQSSADYTDHIVTDQTPGELLEYAPRANVFIEVDASAPRENARTMASEYGLVCQEDLAVRSTPLETLREEKPCSAQASTVGAQQQGNLMGAPGQAPCFSLKQAKKMQREVRVCARPPGVDPTIGRWASNDGKGNLIINTYEAFVNAAAIADIIFIFDETAPPETVYWFVDDPAKLRCKKQPPPRPYATAKASGELDMMASAGAMAAGLNPSTGSGAGSGNAGTGSAGAGTAGSGKPSSTSSPNGQGPALSVFETIVNNMAVGGALAQGNTSGSLNAPNGHRNGIPGGKNVGGFSFPLLQAGVATFQIINAVGLKPKDFIDLVHKASKKGQRTVIEKADKAALDLADDLIKNHGQYPMAQGLQEMQTIMPYSMAEKFTKDLGNAFQAHKIFEKQALEKLKGRQDFEKLPAVILTKEEHQEITNLLNAAWKEYAPNAKTVTAEQLRQIYKKAYARYPHWLEVIEKQLRQLQ